MTDQFQWPKTMTREGHTITREQMKAAWFRATADVPVFQRTHLRWAIHEHGIGFRTPANILIANAMLQHARKHGIVEFTNSAWRLK